MKNVKLILIILASFNFMPLFSQTSTYITHGRQFAFCDATGISVGETKSLLLPPSWGNATFSEQLKTVDFVLDDGSICANPTILDGGIAGSEIHDLGTGTILSFTSPGAIPITISNLPKLSSQAIKGKFLQPKEGHLYCFKSKDNNFILIEVRMIKMVGDFGGLNNKIDLCMIDLRWYELTTSYKNELYKKSN